MTTAIQRAASALVLGLALMTPAGAVPVIFSFALPDWTERLGDPAIYGTSGVLTVQLDNGAPDFLGQTYANHTIQRIRMTAVGGSYDHGFDGASAVSSGGASLLSYFSTDAAGIPMLSLPAQDVGNAYQFFDGPHFLQLATIMPTFGNWPISVTEDFFGTSGFVALSPRGPDGRFVGVVITGTVVAAAEPAAWTLGLMGLSALGLAGLRGRGAPPGHDLRGH